MLLRFDAQAGAIIGRTKNRVVIRSLKKAGFDPEKKDSGWQVVIPLASLWGERLAIPEQDGDDR